MKNIVNVYSIYNSIGVSTTHMELFVTLANSF